MTGRILRNLRKRKIRRSLHNVFFPDSDHPILAQFILTVDLLEPDFFGSPIAAVLQACLFYGVADPQTGWPAAQSTYCPAIEQRLDKTKPMNGGMVTQAHAWLYLTAFAQVGLQVLLPKFLSAAHLLHDRCHDDCQLLSSNSTH